MQVKSCPNKLLSFKVCASKGAQYLCMNEIEPQILDLKLKNKTQKCFKN